MTMLTFDAVLAALLLGGCAVIPIGPVRVADGGRWIARPARDGDPAAALWGLPRGEAAYAVACVTPGTLQLTMPVDRPTPGGTWRLSAGGVAETVAVRHTADGLAVEQAELPVGGRLARVLAAEGGPLLLRAGDHAVTLPASPILARVAAACAL